MGTSLPGQSHTQNACNPIPCIVEVHGLTAVRIAHDYHLGVMLVSCECHMVAHKSDILTAH